MTVVCFDQVDDYKALKSMEVGFDKYQFIHMPVHILNRNPLR